MKKLSIIFLLAFLLAVLLPACGGGGGGGGTPPPPQAPATYLFYINDAGELSAADPVAKTFTMVEASGVFLGGQVEFLAGNYHPSTKELTEMHMRTIVYAKGGKIYKVSALKSGTLAPVQLSNETGATSICGTIDQPDFANPDNSLYAYSLPGADASCDTVGDNVWKAVRLSMTSADVPISLWDLSKFPLTALYDRNTAGILGELVIDYTAHIVLECDANFAHCDSPVLSGIQDATSLGSDINSTREAFWAFDGANYNVYIYDFNTKSISKPVYTTSAALSPAIQDSSGIYFVEGGKQINRLIFTSGDASVSTLVTETANIIAGKLTDTRVVYVTTSTTAGPPTTYTLTLKSLPKTGGSTQVLVTVTDVIPGPLDLVTTAGNGVFYNIYNTTAASYKAGYIYDDGSGPGSLSPAYEVPNTEWTAMSASTTMQAPSEATITKVIRSTDDAAKTVWSFDAKTYGPSSQGIVLGTMPDGYFYEFYGGEIGNDIIGAGVNSTTGKPDIFCVKGDTASSLWQVTTTPDVDERPFGWY